MSNYNMDISFWAVKKVIVLKTTVFSVSQFQKFNSEGLIVFKYI